MNTLLEIVFWLFSTIFITLLIAMATVPLWMDGRRGHP